MFSFVSNASKVALLHLIERLIVGNFKLLDTQFINNHLKQFGAMELSNKEFKKILDKTLLGTFIPAFFVSLRGVISAYLSWPSHPEVHMEVHMEVYADVRSTQQ